jgi:hypothetical protein
LFPGNAYKKSSELAKKARKVLFSLREKTSSLGILPISVSINLFDILVRPILTYNSEISFMDYCLARYKISCELIKFSTGNLPSSALTPIFEEVFFVPRKCLQKIK